MKSIQPVILCGGEGTRLWPMSRVNFPKQFHCLNGKLSFFQQAVLRLNKNAFDGFNFKKPIILTNEIYRFLVLEQLQRIDVGADAIILEPINRNTAASLTLAALEATKDGDDPNFIVSPADHFVENEKEFLRTASLAVDASNCGKIALLGIRPDKPETGFGYIETIDVDGDSNKLVSAFFEKPNLQTAKKYFQKNEFFWNSGFFFLKANLWTELIKIHEPSVFKPVVQSWNERKIETSLGATFIRPQEISFELIKEISIDKAVIERCPESLSLIPLDAGWSDIGSWSGVWKLIPKNSEGNAVKGDLVSWKSKNNLVISSNRLVGLVNIENLVIVDTADAIVIADQTKTQDITHIVAELKNLKRDERVSHREVHRPWGWYEVLDEKKFFKVKKITVKPGASLSLQKHQFRSEHWVVVRGVAKVLRGENVFTLKENESTFIPLGEKHRLTNIGKEELEIIEVQTGTYLGEDDIERFGDNYGRSN